MEQFFLQNGDIIIKLVLALVLGTVIGLERILVHKEAGMKTHALVTMGAALFIIVSEAISLQYGDITGFDPSRIASQIVVGIGFLGAGSIIMHGSHLKGLTTAAGFWVTAGIGMTVGFGLFDLAVIATILVLLIFTLLNILEKPIREFSDGKFRKDEGNN